MMLRMLQPLLPLRFAVLTLKNENSQQLHEIPYFRRGRKIFKHPRNRRDSLNILPSIGTLGLQRFWEEQPRARKSTKLRTIQKSQIFSQTKYRKLRATLA